MQVQNPKQTSGYLPLAESGHQANFNFIPQVNFNARWSISTGVDAQAPDVHAAKVQMLASFAEQLAVGLFQTLNVLKIYDVSEVNRIMSILEPFTEATEELDFDMPPISSTKGTARVIQRGIAEPEFYFE